MLVAISSYFSNPYYDSPSKKPFNYFMCISYLCLSIAASTSTSCTTSTSTYSTNEGTDDTPNQYSITNITTEAEGAYPQHQSQGHTTPDTIASSWAMNYHEAAIFLEVVLLLTHCFTSLSGEVLYAQILSYLIFMSYSNERMSCVDTELLNAKSFLK